MFLSFFPPVSFESHEKTNASLYSASAFICFCDVGFSHYSQLPQRFAMIAKEYIVPFEHEREVKTVHPEAEKEGLRLKDKIVAVNGRTSLTDEIYREEMQTAEKGLPLNLTVNRQTDARQIETLDLIITPMKVDGKTRRRNSAVHRRLRRRVCQRRETTR